MKKTRILVVDDHSFIRDTLPRLIAVTAPHLEICATAEDACSAMEVLEAERPDISLVDISLDGDEGGLALMTRIRSRYPDQAIFAVSLHDAELYAVRALQAGADGYLNKEHLATELSAAVSEVMAGRGYISGKSGHELLRRYADSRYSAPNTQ